MQAAFEEQKANIFWLYKGFMVMSRWEQYHRAQNAHHLVPSPWIRASQRSPTFKEN